VGAGLCAHAPVAARSMVIVMTTFRLILILNSSIKSGRRWI
jgi:hypothetical protein